ncbi:MAG: hypothetical protein RR497_04500, partial [Oscillospiraceae bacterium]
MCSPECFFGNNVGDGLDRPGISVKQSLCSCRLSHAGQIVGDGICFFAKKPVTGKTCHWHVF